MGFLILGNKTFDFSCKKKDFLPKNDQIWPNIGIFGQLWPAMQAYTVPCGSVGGCGARAVSRKTPIYFIYLSTNVASFHQRLSKVRRSDPTSPTTWTSTAQDCSTLSLTIFLKVQGEGALNVKNIFDG